MLARKRSFLPFQRGFLLRAEDTRSSDAEQSVTLLLPLARRDRRDPCIFQLPVIISLLPRSPG